MLNEMMKGWTHYEKQHLIVFEFCDSKIKRILIPTVNYKINANQHYQHYFKVIFLKFIFFVQLYGKYANFNTLFCILWYISHSTIYLGFLSSKQPGKCYCKIRNGVKIQLNYIFIYFLSFGKKKTKEGRLQFLSKTFLIDHLDFKWSKLKPFQSILTF